MDSTHDRYSIRRLMSPRDEAIDLDEGAWVRALELTRSAFRADPGRDESRTEPEAPQRSGHTMRAQQAAWSIIYLCYRSVAGWPRGRIAHGCSPHHRFCRKFSGQ